MNFRNYFNNTFKDSYGWDKFSLFVIMWALILLLISKWLFPLSFALGVWTLWRAFSKNKYKRQQEEMAFESFVYRVKYKFTNLKSNIMQNANYKILTCPNCSQKLRVPRHKGNITVTCKKCHNQFKAKS